MESVASSPVSLTPGAVAEVKRLMAEPLFDKNQSLRLGVKGGGCSGMSYILGFDLPTDSDERFEIEAIPCIMDKTHGIYLMGMEVDWQNGLNARGFSFINTNASKTCGCGSSFAV
jgi:iron-sulfur cluster assembly protein